jgi:cytoskeletal protein RodZ
MSDLGRLLQQGREAQGLTLSDIERNTHIRRTYISALEEGLHDQLPSVVYTRGLVLNYARYLGIDMKEASRLFGVEYGRPLISSKEIGSHQPLAEPLQVSSQRWAGVAIVVVVVALVAFALWWFWPTIVPWGRYFLHLAQTPLHLAASRPDAPTATATVTLPAVGTTARAQTPTLAPGEPTAAATEPLELPTSAALSLPTPTTFVTETPTVQPTATAVPVSGLRMTLSVTSPAWVRVTVDGAVAYEGTMSAGETREFTAQDNLLLHTGNAGGTSVMLNGNDVGSLGAGGEVVRREWLWRDGQSVEATPEA